MRHRESSTSQDAEPLIYQFTDGTTHETTTYPLDGARGNLQYRFINDVVTPSYKKLSAEGHFIVSPCVIQNDEFEYTSGTETSTHNDDRSVQIISGDIYSFRSEQDWLVSFSHDSLPDVSRLRLIVSQQALARVDGSSVKMAEDTLELEKTMELIRSPLGAAKQASEAFRNKYTSLVANGMVHSRALAKSWLIYNYVYANTFRSVVNAINGARQVDRSRPVYETSRFASDAEYSSSSSCTTNGMTFSQHITQTWHIAAGVKYSVVQPASGWQRALGLRAKDMIPGVWEVLPYSWVIDRFVDFDSSIRACIAQTDVNLRIVAAWTTEMSRTSEVTSYDSSVVEGWTVNVSPSKKKLTSKRYMRQDFPAFDEIRGAFVQYEHFNSTQNVVDDIALILANLRI